MKRTTLFRIGPLFCLLLTLGNGPSFAVEPVNAGDEAVVRIVTDKSGGTGFFINEFGTVLTCLHVVRDAEAIQLFWNGRAFGAEVIGTDPKYDQAVLTIFEAGTPYLKVQRPYFERILEKDRVREGTPVRVIGHPLGRPDPVVKTGTVTAVHYQLNRLFLSRVVENIIFQTDAVVEHGNSGSPAFNADGRVIGIVTAKVALKDGKDPNVGFIYAIDRFIAERRLLFQSLHDGERVALCKRKVSRKHENPFYMLALGAGTPPEGCVACGYADSFVGSFLGIPLFYEFKASFPVGELVPVEGSARFVRFLRELARVDSVRKLLK